MSPMAAEPIRIVGSGPSALAFALFALRQGFAPHRLRLERFDAPPAPALAARQLAMSAGSWQLLGRVARQPRAAPVETVDVTLLGHPGRTRISAAEMGLPALGYVLRYADLLAVLQQAATQAGLRSCAAPVELVDRDGHRVPHDGDEPDALTVHAEGDTGDDADRLEFGQSALLAEVEVAPAHGNVAFECFTADGPLALLPLPEAHRYSLVWCDRHAQTERRASLAPQALAEELQSAFGWPLGRVAIASPVFVAPMVRRRRRQVVGPREAWIGNAAQALHPVAGQGLNLGLRDAFSLAQALGDAEVRGEPAQSALAVYAGERARDRDATIGLTDTLARGFGLAALRPLQSAALAFLDLCPPARTTLARRFAFGVRG